jgi:hypothetical protein
VDDPPVPQFDRVSYTLGVVSERTTRQAIEAATARGDALGTSARTQIIIVHGHNDGLKEKVARFLAKLAKVSAKYAVVLATGDDLGRAKAAGFDVKRSAPSAELVSSMRS